MSSPHTGPRRSGLGLRHYGVALRAMLVLTLALGLVYPLVLTGAGRIMANHAEGSMVSADGRTVGSALIGQSFTDAAGQPLTRYFQSRPSAAGDGYDPRSSGGSNLGPDNPVLVERITQQREEIASVNGVLVTQVPADAVTASASGLDPDISPGYALLQVARVATARGLPEAQVRALVASHLEGRDLGFLGEEHVNVLLLNVALDKVGR